MCQSNTCGCNVNGRIIPNVVVPQEADIDIVGIDPIKVRTYLRGTTKVFEISLVNNTPPTVTITSDVNSTEFNKPFTATYTVTYAQGNSPVSDVDLDPIPSPLPDTSNSPFTFSITDTPIQAGIGKYSYSVTVTDELGQSANASKSIDVLYRYYKGVLAFGSTLNNSKVATFDSKLSTDINTAYGTLATYTNNTDNPSVHYCWLYPTDSLQINLIKDQSGNAVPTTIEPYTLTINGAEYYIVRTTGSYSQFTTAQFQF